MNHCSTEVQKLKHKHKLLHPLNESCACKALTVFA